MYAVVQVQDWIIKLIELAQNYPFLLVVGGRRDVGQVRRNS